MTTIRRIRYIIEPLFYLLGRCAYFIVPSKLTASLDMFLTFLYTCWKRNEFKSFGKHSLIFRRLAVRGAHSIVVGEDTMIGKNSEITAISEYRGSEYHPSIKIGNNCRLGENIHVSSINSIVIGDGTLTGKYVTIVDNSHGGSSISNLPPAQRRLCSRGRVVIGENVWIGDKTTILPGVEIGDGCIIGANSVVTKSIPPFSLAVGNPAIIKKTMKK